MATDKSQIPKQTQKLPTPSALPKVQTPGPTPRLPTPSALPKVQTPGPTTRLPTPSPLPKFSFVPPGPPKTEVSQEELKLLYELLQVSLEADSTELKNVKDEILEELKVCLEMNVNPSASLFSFMDPSSYSKYATELSVAKTAVTRRLAKAKSELRAKNIAATLSRKAGQLESTLNAYYCNEQDNTVGAGGNSTTSSVNESAVRKRKFEEDFDKQFEEFDKLRKEWKNIGHPFASLLGGV